MCEGKVPLSPKQQHHDPSHRELSLRFSYICSSISTQHSETSGEKKNNVVVVVLVDMSDTTVSDVILNNPVTW